MLKITVYNMSDYWGVELSGQPHKYTQGNNSTIEAIFLYRPCGLALYRALDIRLSDRCCSASMI